MLACPCSLIRLTSKYRQKKEEFLESLDVIVKSMDQSLNKEESKMNREKKANEELNQQYTTLVC